MNFVLPDELPTAVLHLHVLVCYYKLSDYDVLPSV